MDFNTVQAFIGSVGFPIAVCCYAGYFLIKVMREFKDSVNANTSVLRELTIYVQELRSETKEAKKNE